MSEINIYRVTPRQARKFILEVLQAGLVPFLQSSPGMGKSSIFRSIAKECRLKLIDHRLSTSAPEDMTGLPRFGEDGLAYFSPFADLFPIEGAEVPEGYDGWMLFLDELNSAPKSVEAAAYKLLLDRMTGQKKLHERVVMGAAGNLMTDKAIVNPLGTAMQSRLVHLEMEISFKEWLEDVAIAERYDPSIIAFLSYNEGALMSFDPNHKNKTFNCPRTWEFMNRLVTANPISEERTPLYAGAIDSGTAVEFVQFASVQNHMIKIPEILRDPANAAITTDNAARWMVICHMANGITEDNFAGLCTYADRFDLTFRILFYRMALKQQKELRSHPAYIKAMSSLSKYLYDPVTAKAA